MTRDQIKTELRRSACEDAEPWSDVAEDAFWVAFDMQVDDEWRESMSRNDAGVFFLLVAEALED